MSKKEQTSTTQSSPYLVPLAIIIAGALVGAGIYFGGKQPQPPAPERAAVQQQEEPQEQPGEGGEVAGEKLEKTVGDFVVLDEEPCLEDGKPVVYYFGSSGCPHSRWEHPLIKEVAESFGGKISFYDLMDKQEKMDVFQKYLNINGGGIPFIVLGCKYARVGSGERVGEEAEKQALTELICNLTNNEPSEVCQ